jgi:hypothetical protein
LLILYRKFPVGNPDTKTFLLDGVVSHLASLPGATVEGYEAYNHGTTTVHEVGHWLGLFHTFEAHDGDSGCEGPGDLVFDTPAERNNSFGCAVVSFFLIDAII